MGRCGGCGWQCGARRLSSGAGFAYAVGEDTGAALLYKDADLARTAVAAAARLATGPAAPA